MKFILFLIACVASTSISSEDRIGIETPPNHATVTEKAKHSKISQNHLSVLHNFIKTTNELSARVKNSIIQDVHTYSEIRCGISTTSHLTHALALTNKLGHFLKSPEYCLESTETAQRISAMVEIFRNQVSNIEAGIVCINDHIDVITGESPFKTSLLSGHGQRLQEFLQKSYKTQALIQTPGIFKIPIDLKTQVTKSKRVGKAVADKFVRGVVTSPMKVQNRPMRLKQLNAQECQDIMSNCLDWKYDSITGAVFRDFSKPAMQDPSKFVIQ